jgi:hypothetical protein
MPGLMLHVGAQVICMHAGQAEPVMPCPRVTLSGQLAVTITSPWVVAGCVLPPPPAANGPCVTAMYITAATRVTAMGQPVLLFDSMSICAPSGTPLQTISCQTRATAQ